MRKILFCLLLATACKSADKKAEPTQVAIDKSAPAEGAGSAAVATGSPDVDRIAEDKPAEPKLVDKAGVASKETVSGDGFKSYGQNPWVDASKDRLSTFAADVDTASYTIMRRLLTEGKLPPAASVRVEEFVNYFDYAFAEPTSGTPFSVIMQAAPSPMNPARHILRVGVGTKAKSEHERKPANLVFLVDVSGSMSGEDRLGLAKKSLRILTQNLEEGDTVALVTYAGSSRVILKPTGVENKARIL